MKTETCFASGENQRKPHTLAVNNDQQHKPRTAPAEATTAAPPSGGSGGTGIRTGMSERVSQWPMSRGDEC